MNDFYEKADKLLSELGVEGLAKIKLQNVLYDYFSYVEHDKINKIIIYDDFTNNLWHIQHDGTCCPIGYGMIAIDYMNQLISFKSKDMLNAYQKRKYTYNVERFDSIFDESISFSIIPFCDRIFREAEHYEPGKEISDDLYKELEILWKYKGNDIEDMINKVKTMISLPLEKRLYYLPGFYLSLYKTLHQLTHIQLSASRFTQTLDEFRYLGLGKTREDLEKDKKEYIDELNESYCTINEKIIANGFRYLGIGAVGTIDDFACCKKYEAKSLIDFILEDFVRLFTSTDIAPKICEKCGFFFIANHGNKKHCPVCSDDNYLMKGYYNKSRQGNEERWLHKRIQDQIKNVYDKKNPGSTLADAVRIESNYYYDIVRGKEPKTPKLAEYKDIKTMKQYRKWLESTLEKYKRR